MVTIKQRITHLVDKLTSVSLNVNIVMLKKGRGRTVFIRKEVPYHSAT